MRTVALVDSGATVTFIPPELSEAVGLEVVERDVEAEGAGGDFLNNVCRFRLEVLNKGEVQAVMQGDAHVPKDQGRIPFVVLGRDHLFAAYDIEFRENRERVVLKNARESS